MLRSLNSGVTGLINHQVRMDVIGNNISNVNTVGYKGRRVTFEESFNQLVKGASRTENKAGGTNPMQVGLGVSVGSIDVMTGQGNLQNTGRIFDLAIEGSAFFGVSDGEGTYYTKNGAFQLDSNGYIMLPTNGMVLQGRMADTYGNFPPGTAIGNLQIPMSQQSPAKETTEISLGRNLNAEADAKGNIVYSQKFLHPADGARAGGIGSTHGDNDTGRTETSLISLHNSNGQHLGIQENDVLTISWYNQATIVPGVTTTTGEISVKIERMPSTDPFNPANGKVWNLEQLRQAIQYQLNNDKNGVSLGTAHTVDLMPDGSLRINHAGGAEIFNLQISSSNSESNSYVNTAFHFGSHIGPASGNYPANMQPTSDVLLRPAEQFDFIHMLTDGTGTPLVPGLENGDTIDVFGSVGKNSIEEGKSEYLFFWDGTGANPVHPVTGQTIQVATMLEDLITKIRNDFKLPAEYVDRDGVHIPSVSMNAAGTDDKMPDGSIVIYGAKGKDFSINNLAIKATNSNSNQNSPINFNSVLNFKEKRAAEDVGVFETVVPVYDESGAEHTLTVTFIHTGKAGEWAWRTSFAGKEEIIPGSGTGTVTFGQDGTVSSFIFDNGGSQLLVDPRNGSNMMRIGLNVGGPGDFRGITQYASATTVNCTGQDGYPTGNLIEVSIDEFGLIEGSFSNGTSRSIAQIMLIDFANPGGLTDLTDSVYTTSANSGDPIWGLPLTQSSSKLKPGSLEMSNVDLAGEFTNMITTQRGYQANSRIITVSDQMLEELVNLKR
ncbi:MAG: flagellar hook-basal body complex protein [Fibromonadales bacterium]|nr:flagellar hook-basal body complex protein [Fibromonadales bacterium]